MKSLPAFLLFMILWQAPILGQLTGGRYVYTFLNLPASARIAALGGDLITVADDDINLALGNPAALNQTMHQRLGFNHCFYPGGIQQGYATYGHYLKRLGATFHAGVQYANYGDLTQTNEFFQTEGAFKVKESAIVLGGGMPIDERLSVGLNLKFITSQFSGNQSIGVATDLAGMYQDTSRNLVFSLVIRHLGTQLTSYGEDNIKEPLPFEMQIGVSKRLKYLPFRFSAIYRNLQRWNVLYDDPNDENGTLFLGEEPKEPSAFAQRIDNFFRHFVFSGELLIGARENFRLRFGYDHRMRRELSTDGFGSAAGFSFGTGIKINRFRLDYGRTNFHLAGGLNHFSISTSLQEFKKK